MVKKVYFRLKSRHWIKDKTVVLKDISQIITEGIPHESIENMKICELTEADKSLEVVDAMKVVEIINKNFPGTDVQVVGPTQSIIYRKEKGKGAKPILFIFVWLLLFIGAGLAVMNFHEDVSMQEVHVKIHQVITGEIVEHPLWLQIPYSIGLGLGMILFFNHVFRKRINEEPSPMEVEMFNYEENMDRYISVYENDAWKRK
ncbi:MULTISPECIES: stage V sporulation protein AA [Bacillaceae]|uniref:Stage V sporulation protein AA n=1 Tax=Evansella alkalicola TaxID=745819 RepID=A0ABS6JZL7_9BACI|nr:MULTISPECIES: stage V sporulation protein AA [Bacillaceae]MBU9724029.1 stage V sporulation protein AA [Bacillus alkalicola]